MLWRRSRCAAAGGRTDACCAVLADRAWLPQLGSTAIGVRTKEGVVLAVEKRVTSPLLVRCLCWQAARARSFHGRRRTGGRCAIRLTRRARWQEPRSIEKVAEVDEHIGVAMSGLTADARTLVEHARVETQARRRLARAHARALRSGPDAAGRARSNTASATTSRCRWRAAPRRCATLRCALARTTTTRRRAAAWCAVSAYKLPASDAALSPALTPARAPQSRPFGVALLIAGWDAGAVLYQTDPSGTFAEFSAKAIGSGSEGAQTALQARAGAAPRAARAPGGGVHA
jgi:20S proteasome alpha/beta subunit